MSAPLPGCLLLKVDHHCRSRRAALLRVDEGNHSSCALKIERSRRRACGTASIQLTAVPESLRSLADGTLCLPRAD